MRSAGPPSGPEKTNPMYYVLSDYTIHVTGKGMPGPARCLEKFSTYAAAQAWINKRTGVKPGKNKYA